jgi:hypothetical protein
MIRNSFVKLVPRRFVPDAELTSIGGNQYTTTFIDIEPETVYQDRGGVNPVSLTFAWNGTTKTTTITTTVAPDEDIFIDYPLRFCGQVVNNIQDDPVTPSGSVVRWEPRLTANPSIPESASNMLNGVLSTSSTTVSIDNSDYGLNKYLTKYDNYKNRSATIYGELGSTYKNIAFGYITKVTSGSKIQVSIKASTKLLEATATLDNTEQYYQYNTTDYSSITEEFDGKAIPVCYGFLSEIPKEGVYMSTVPAGTVDKMFPGDREFTKMVYIGSQIWACGIVDDPWSRLSDETSTLTYVGTETYNSQTVVRYGVQSGRVGNLVESQILKFNKVSAPGTQQARCVFVDYENEEILVKGSYTDLTSVIMYPAHVFHVSDDSYEASFLEGNSIDAINGSNAEFQYELTDSGQYLVKFKWISSSLFNRFKGMPHYCILSSKPRTQSSFVQKYIESTGLSVDSTSFSQAQTDATSDVMITVNPKGKLQSIHEVVENITTSCNGILYFDASTQKYKYKIITTTLAGTDWTLDTTDILEPDIVPSISYGDTASIVNMKHPYTEERAFIDGINSFKDTSFSRAFNSESKSTNISHYLTDTSSIIDLKSETLNTPMITYKFTVMADDYFDIDIGDIVQIENVNGRLLSSGTSLRLLIIARTRSVEKIGLTGYEFEKIP